MRVLTVHVEESQHAWLQDRRLSIGVPIAVSVRKALEAAMRADGVVVETDQDG